MPVEVGHVQTIEWTCVLFMLGFPDADVGHRLAFLLRGLGDRLLLCRGKLLHTV